MQYQTSRLDLYKWHQWFAWYPVKITCYELDRKQNKYIYKYVWLEKVWRKKNMVYMNYIYALVNEK